MNTIYIITIVCVMSVSIIGTIINNKGKSKEEKINKPTKLFLWIIIIILIFISGFRDLTFIKGDEYVYRNYFDRVVLQRKNVLRKDTDIGFWALNFILTKFTHNNQAIILVCAIITNILIVKNLYKHSNYFNFTLFLYIALGIFFDTFNGMRQYIAAAILFQGINYVIDRKKIKYIICVLIATLFHFSAIIMMPMYWIVQIKNKKRLYIYITIASIIFFVAFSTIVGGLGNYINKLNNYYNEFINDDGYGVKIPRILVISLPIILIAIQYKNIIKKDRKLEIIYAYSFICMMFMICAYEYVYIARLCIYFYLYEILIVPELIYSIKKQENRMIIVFITFCLYLTYGFIGNSKNLPQYKTNTGIVINPITLFNKK